MPASNNKNIEKQPRGFFLIFQLTPIDKNERIRALKKLEILAKKTGQTQIFMETPYRNNQLITTILKTCKSSTRLCIASDITMSSENIKTKTILEWKEANINIHKKPTIFLIS